MDTSKPEEKDLDPPVKEGQENDASSRNERKQETTGPVMSEAQKRAIYNLSRRRGISVDELENMVQEKYNTSLENLASKDASGFIRQLQQAA